MDMYSRNTEKPVEGGPPRPEPLIRHGWLRALLLIPAVLLSVMILSILASLVAVVAGADLDGLPSGSEPLMLLFQVVQAVALLVPVWFFRKYIDRRSLTSLGFGFDREMRADFTVGLLAGIVLISIVFLFLWALDAVAVVGVGFPARSLAVMVLLVVVVGFSEEVLFRGYILNNCMDSFNRYVSLVITAVLFSLSHLLNPNPSWMAMVNIVLAGLVLGIYYVHRRNLWFPIGMHITWNLFQGSVFGSEVSGVSAASVFTIDVTGSELLTGGRFGFEASIVTSAVLIVAAVAIHLRYKGQSARPS